MPSAGFYIDGFNLYHSLKGNPRTSKALWLNVRSLCEVIKLKSETLKRIVYFTALPPWDAGKRLRHETFISALTTTGVETVKGRFAPVTKTCRKCHGDYQTFEEKETDANMASRVIRDAVLGEVDSVYLLTGDSDQCPTIRTVKELAPECIVVAVFSVDRHSKELKAAADRHIQLSPDHFLRNQLPSPIDLGPKRQIHCPPNWLPEPPAN